MNHFKLLSVLMAGVCVGALSCPSASAQTRKRGAAGPVERNVTVGIASDTMNAQNAGWHYNWGPSRTFRAASDFFPMIWGGNLSTLDTRLQTALNQPNVNYLLGFNEPERLDQANMSVATAIDRWASLTNAVAGTDIRLISPAVSDTVDGRQWITDFMAQADAQNLQVDDIAFHWYGTVNPSNPAGSATSFLNRVDWYHTTFNRPVWITEFAGNDWGNQYTTEVMQEANRVFLENVIPQLEARSYVHGYAWYASFDDSALLTHNSDGKLEPTRAGDAYIPSFKQGDVSNLNGDTSELQYLYLRGGQLINTGNAVADSGIVRIHAMTKLDGSNVTSIVGGTGDWMMTPGGTVQVSPGAVLRVEGTGTVHLRNINTLNDNLIRIFKDDNPQNAPNTTGNLRISGGQTITRGTGALRVDIGTNLFLGQTGDTQGFDLSWNTLLRGGLITVDSSSIRMTGNAALSNAPTTFLVHGELEISGDITGAGINNHLRKTGAGTLILSGQNSSAGEVIVEAGDLVLTGSTAGGGVRILDTARLKGTGTIQSGLIVQGGGRVAPGDSAGSLTVLNADFQAGSTLEMEIASAVSFDQLVVLQDVVVGENVTLSVAFLDGYLGQANDAFQLLDVAGSLAGMFASFDLPTLANGLLWDTSSLAIDGVLSIVGSIAQAGDYNGSGSVEQGDLDLVLNNWGGPRGNWSNAEGFNSAGVDQEELDRVLNNWGSSAAPSFGGSAVPEPGTMATLAASLLLLRRQR